MDLNLKDKLAFVSGSTRGIGRAIAEGMLREGARVAISGRGKEDLDRTNDDLRTLAAGDRLLAVQGDLSREEDIQNCVRTVQAQWGGLDILVANIGSGRGIGGWDVPAEEWRRLLDQNLTGGALLVRAVVPLLRARGGGSIVFVSSLAGVEAVPAPLPYGAAKAALLALSKGLSRQLAPWGIRVNAIAPGNILFPGGVWDHKLKEDPEEVKDYIAKEVPLQRMGTPQEVADCVLFLASHKAAFITGVCLLVDGGQARSW